ncbi:MAG: hypothetical protein ABRQ25_09230 [Clostridiaceae bacterium]
MSDVNARQVMEEMMLRQIGAQVLSIHGVQCFAKFYINGHKVNYLFNITPKNKYYLQRIKPYPMAIGDFEDTTSVVKAIENDCRLFKNATQRGNFETFVSVNNKMIETRRNFEDMVLRGNADPEMFDLISRNLDEINKIIGSEGIEK